jgi:tRNA pseudouridine38-40 synthase
VETLKLCVAYDGTEFSGWQRQRGDRTVQQVLEEAIARAVGHRVTVVGAGRTDSGVHALGQVATFRTDSTIPAERLPFAVNQHLPSTVRVTACEQVPPTFHPCQNAVGKHYRYTAWCGRIGPALLRDFVAQIRHELRWEPMVEAAEHMVGRRDFSAFRTWAKGQEHLGSVKEIKQIHLKAGGRLLLIDVLGSGFLYKQVRTMVGTLVEVGRGRVPPERVPEIVASRDRRRAGPTAPAKGLCLVKVFYEEIPPSWFDTPGPVVWDGCWRTELVGAPRASTPNA